MLENARSQFFLVLLTIVAALVCVFTFKVPLGHDLKGGTQLRYEIPPDVVEKLRQKESISNQEILEQTIAVITERIDPTGALDPTIQPAGELGFMVEMPYFEDAQDLNRVLERIGNLGSLEMRMVAEQNYRKEQVNFGNLAAEKQRLEEWLKQPENAAEIKKDYRRIRQFNDDPQRGPMSIGSLAWYPHLLRPQGSPAKWETPFTGSGGELGSASVKFWEDADWNGGTVPDAMLQKPERDRYLVEFVAVNMYEQHFTGKDLDPAGVSGGPSPRGGLGVNYSIKADRAGDYADWSERNFKKHSAIILNGVIKSAPYFEGKIAGNGIISGNFTNDEVDDLVKVLRTGSLRVEPERTSLEQIGPILGKAAIARGAWSLVAGGVLIFVFMLWYYGMAGTIACVTLTLNVFLLWAAMLFMQATVTLPGLGGIVLTMGMAVDANVLIYERIREELAKGKEMLQAVRAGFDRAMSAILDSNITTFLVGLVLFNVGTGPVRGFAVALMVGIVTTVFTQFFVTRLLFHFALAKGWLSNYKPRTLFTGFNADFVRWMKPCVAASVLLIGAGLAYTLFVAPREETLGIDFTGGANLRMVLAQPTTDQAVRDQLAGDAAFQKAYPNVRINTVGVPTDGGSRQFNVRLKLTDTQRAAIDAGRRLHRETSNAAAAANQAPPPPFEPPYAGELRRIFANQLVAPAFTDPIEAPVSGQANLKFAQIDLHFIEPVELAKVREHLQKTMPGAMVSATSSSTSDAAATEAKDLRVEWKAQSSLRLDAFDDTVDAALAGLKDKNDKDLMLSEPFPEAQEIQGRLVNELRNAAIGALLLAMGLIVLYLRIRFHEYKYGFAAVLALIHDVLVALVVVVVCNHLGLVHAEIDLAMIACFLTIIGYSVNDTIVIFDRIRENATDNVRAGKKEPFRDLINRALNQTMSRTLLTSGLTLLVVIAQFVVNYGSGSGLESFAFAMIVGMVSGVYSTIYIAAPVLIWLDRGDLSEPTLPPEPIPEPAESEVPAEGS